MNRRQLLRAAGLAALGSVAGPVLKLGRCRLEAATGGVVEVATRAVDLVLESVVIDMLGLLTLDWPRLARWRRSPELFGEGDFRRLEASGVQVFHPAVTPTYEGPFDAAIRWIEGWNRLLSAQPCFLARVDSVAELLVVRNRGAIGVVIGFQSSEHFRTRDDVGRFFALGQRVSQLTYNSSGRLGSGCFEPRDRGLTRFGAEVVREMNRLGMAIDVSHCGERTSLQAVETSAVPVLATHANCRALVPGQPRCKSDRFIRRLAARGGVIGMTVVRAFVAARARPSIDDLLDHFDHVAKLVGPEHVGLGSDTDATALDPVSGRPSPLYQLAGLDPALRVFQIADGLLRRGWRPADVDGVLGGNFLRALAAIWPAAPWPEERRREASRDPFCPPPQRRGAVDVKIGETGERSG